MADPQQAIDDVVETMTDWMALLDEMWSMVCKRVVAKIEGIRAALEGLIAGAEEIARAAAIRGLDSAVAAAQAVLGFAEGIRATVRLMRRWLQRMIDQLADRTVNDIADAVARVLKKAKAFKSYFLELAEGMLAVFAQLDPIRTAMAAIQAERRTLEAQFPWVAEAGSVGGVLARVEREIKTIVKELKADRRVARNFTRSLRAAAAA